jgi:hypothetical protein
MRSIKSVVLLIVASAVVAVAVGQDDRAPERPPAAAPPPASTPPAGVPPAAETDAAPQDASGASDDEFVPTEELSADSQVTFPVDI